jgi:hypothetical protein
MQRVQKNKIERKIGREMKWKKQNIKIRREWRKEKEKYFFITKKKKSLESVEYIF